MAHLAKVCNFVLGSVSALLPLSAYADRYGIKEAMEDGPSSGDGLLYLLGGAGVGAGIGFIYGLYHNGTHTEKIALDGCMILGGLIGGFVLPFVYIILIK